ncbi:MAG: PTS sugar transporter subunit IIA [Candidatus Hydrogenedentes bacterium]|nr:PTS sugar transporter subunit IIA [Candidatus Hydrogenedentota bacterium]
MAETRADAFLRMIRRSQRGRLKVYLGYCAGVGKTYQMLEEGQRLQREGIDVVVGYVETHGRAETARLVEGLEVIPRHEQAYRGISVEEMDVDAIMARRPQVALIDELAHTNVPGSKHAKRYQDVQDILAMGIHVITTLNVQHLESLYDMVEHATGVKVRERLPGSILSDADQIVNVDLTTEDLRKRLQEGKVYTQERIETALNHFFTSANLEQLRELTLRELASQLDQRRREPDEETMAAPDQVVVCLSSRGPNSEMLLRYASRLAGRLNRNWYAVYVQTPSETPELIDAKTQRLLSNTLTLAKQLGAIVFTYKGADVVETILQFAREYRVGHIVIGSPTRSTPWWKRLSGQKTVAERLISCARGFTVVVIDTRRGERPVPRPQILTDEFPEKRPAPPAPSVAMRGLGLGDLLTEDTVLIWREPADRDAILADLVAAACRISGFGDASAVLAAIIAREKQGSTFFNEGVAFPHARVEGLPAPVLALGLTQAGVLDVETHKTIYWVALILTPASQSNAQVQLLALVSKSSQDAQLVAALRAADSPSEAMRILRG